MTSIKSSLLEYNRSYCLLSLPLDLIFFNFNCTAYMISNNFHKKVFKQTTYLLKMLLSVLKSTHLIIVSSLFPWLAFESFSKYPKNKIMHSILILYSCQHPVLWMYYIPVLTCHISINTCQGQADLFNFF